MLRIEFGDRNPKVVLLQILLNRHGGSLVVDGCYGERTRAAVGAFQRGSSPPRDGTVDPATFNALFEDSRLSIIDVLDAGDPMVPDTAVPVITGAGGAPPIQLGLMCNGVEQMVSDVLRSSANPIALLRITGHGNLGRWMTVSVGSVAHLPADAYREVAAERFSYISNENFEELRRVLSPLSSRFARFGSMEHHGCSIGSVPGSRSMMGRLSDLWRVPITAGRGLQMAQGIPRFTGRVFSAYPNNDSLSSWSSQFRNASF